jgi:phage portal protein BeeE
MNPIKSLFSKFTKNSTEKSTGDYNPNLWNPVGGSGTYSLYKHNDYENAYSSISKIVQGFASVAPYAVNSSGDVVDDSLIIDKISIPNREMSAYDFREALMLMYLVHDVTYIRVHYRGSLSSRGLRAEQITGFTFLEGITPYLYEGRQTYKLRNGDLIDEREVIAINSANPYNLTGGYSTSRAARRWTRLDDYIADYQTGFFKNGAVPAGMFRIVAKTRDQFLDIKQAMIDKHQGAGKNNNIAYSWVPVDNSGQTQSGQIEWVPFNSQNKDMALKDLLEAVNNKVDSAFGVPSEIRGHIQNSNYASVRTAERVFVDYTLRPLTFKIWDKISHELVRITGGFGEAITFNMPTPDNAEENRDVAQAKKLEVESLMLLTGAGYTVESAVTALRLDDSYTNLQAAQVVVEAEENITTEKEEDLPSQEEESIVNRSVSKQLTEIERIRYEQDIELEVQSILNRQVNEAIDEYDQEVSRAVGDSVESEEWDNELTSAMVRVLVPLLILRGAIEHSVGLQILFSAGLSTDNIPAFTLSQAQRDAYTQYLRMVARGFNSDTAEAIRRTLAVGQAQGLTVAEIKSNLSLLIDERYRVTRLAVSEVNRAQNRAGVHSMEDIQRNTGYTIKKVWKTTGTSPCPICLSLEGTEVDVSDTFWGVDQTIVGTDGKEYTNTFVSAHTADAHPNCHCVQEYVVE